MADSALTLRHEEGRRCATALALLGAFVVSAMPVSNERALFSPFGNDAELAEIAPAAYAVVLGRDDRASPAHRGRSRGGVGNGPPAAFGARLPAPAGPLGDPAVGPLALSPEPILPTASRLSSPGSPPGLDSPGLSNGGGGGGGNPSPGPVSPVPEPATWMTMILGFGFVGAMLRRRRNERPERPPTGGMVVSAG